MSVSLNTSLSIASSGLSAVQYELAIASQNVANASTPGYVSEIANVASRQAGGQSGGVVIQLTTRAVNDALQNSLYSQNATVAGLGVTVNALNAVSAVQGSTSADAGTSGTLSDQLGNLQSSFTTLDGSPSSVVDQQAVVSSAASLASSIQTTSATYQTQRQDAQQAVESEVNTINSNLSTIGSISSQIVQMQLTGQDTASLENQRSAAMSTLSNSLNVKFTETSNGDMLVTTANGTSLPTRGVSGPLSTTAMTTVGVNDAYPGTIPTIELNGQDVTTSLTGGTLGANLTLRDTTLPTMQAELDSFSSTLAARFSDQGLTLFTDASGASPATSSLPAGGEIGFSSTIQVNPLVKATPSMVRDGSQAIQDPSSGAAVVTGATKTGASAFTPNPVGGPVGFTTLISNILNYTFGTTIAAGATTTYPGATAPASTTYAAESSTGLGVNQNLSSPYVATGQLTTLATTLTASQAQTIAAATAQQTSQTDIQTTLQTNLTSTSGVSVDDQMANVVALQNAYESNAKVVAAVQTMFTALLTAIS